MTQPMTHRYFCATPIAGERALLDGPEAHHLLHVMRAEMGAEVVLFDGTGAEFPARVEQVGRTEVELAILQRRPVDRELPVAITLGVALPKGDRQKWLVEKAVELGVARLIPLVTVHAVAAPNRRAIERLGRTVIEASKQCGRNRLMQIAEPESWDLFVSAEGGAHHGRSLVAHPGGTSLAASLTSGRGRGQTVALAVGPEGGLADQELLAAQVHRWQMVDLGPRILRIETAAALLVALVTLAGEPPGP